MDSVQPRSASVAPPASRKARARYLAALEWLYRFANYERQPSGHIFNLDRPRLLLHALGAPQSTYRSVVIAGTKGKGSTAAMLQSILSHEGRRIGLYTQPHLHTYRERIRVGDRLIDEGAFADEVDTVRDGVEAVHANQPHLGRLTAYEVGTALALRHFAGQAVDLAVLEVGLGGRLDAVNAVESSLAVVTPISLDHTDLLGSSVAEIAAEKAGIIHHGSRVISAPQSAEAQEVIEQACRGRGAGLEQVAQDDVAPLEHAVFEPGLPVDAMRGQTMQSFRVRGWSSLFSLPLGGQHQLLNAATALRAARLLQPELSEEQAAAGLAAVQWPGRLEVLGARPTVVADGAHNGSSAECLAQAVQAHFRWRRLVLVIGTSADKDLHAILAPLLPLAHAVVATQSESPRALPAGAVRDAVTTLGASATSAESVPRALSAAVSSARADDLILVTGSLFVVAEARAHFGLGVPGP